MHGQLAALHIVNREIHAFANCAEKLNSYESTRQRYRFLSDDKDRADDESECCEREEPHS